MDQRITLPTCVYSDIFWFVSGGSLCPWLATCSSSSFAALSHPSWRHRSLRCFGGELAELSLDHDWRQLYLRLSRTCHWMAAMKQDGKLEEAVMTRRKFQLGHVCERDMELQWSLAVPTPELEAASLLCYDGVSCELCEVNQSEATSTTQILWKNNSQKVQPLRAVVGDSIFLLAKSDRVDVYDLNGSWTRELLAGPQVDLLKSTDMFLADGKLVVEQPLQLLVWDTKSSGQLELLRPTPAIVYGQEEKLHPLQSRPSGASTLAIWAEEGGHSVQFWSIEPECRQVARWVPSVPTPQLHTTLITFGVSVGEGLLVALDRSFNIHVAQLIIPAWSSFV